MKKPSRTVSLTLGLACAGLLALPAVDGQADTIDASTPDGYLAVQRKIACSTRDEHPVTYSWRGRVYSRVPGERDKHLFNIEGMNIRQCGSVEDPDRGAGYRFVSREIMLYLDPETNEVLREWENPWTGETVEVIHVANDPVNARRPTYGRDEDGNVPALRLRELNGTWLQRAEVPLFYTNPLGGAYQKYVGGTYHATEIFDFNGEMDELMDADQHTAYPVVSWVRISQWLPWMEMGGRMGNLYFNAMGKKLESFDQLPPVMLDEIAANYPEYTAPPPIDDDRPNETSWTYMKKILDERGEDGNAEGGH